MPKLILSPASIGLNFYPVQAEGGKILLADVVKPPASSGQASTGQPAEGSTQPIGGQGKAESPTAPPGPPPPIVALDAGHGGEDNGGHSQNGVLEKNVTAQYVAAVRLALLAGNKFRVVLCRTGDVNVGMDQRALAANLAGAFCFLSFHAGDLGSASPRITIFTFQPPAAQEPVATGTSTSAFVPWGQAQEMHLGQSLQLAQALQHQLASLNGVEVDLPATAPVRVLRNVNAPAVAIELGRLAPDADAAALTNPGLQQQFALAVAQALSTFGTGGN
jgi:N-acetylmuramoyl-L-alanine amidase